MRIAIDVSPLSSGHSIRGVGFYLKNLLEALEKYHPEHTYIKFTDKEKIPDTVDIVHYPYFDPFFRTLPLFPHRNTVVTVHDITPLVFPDLFPIGIKGKINWFLQEKSLKRVGRVITDSQSSKNDIEKFLKIDERKVDSIYLAAGEHFKIIQDKSRLSDVLKKYKLPDTFALYVGDATPNKNLPNLVKAVLRTKIPLVMVGKTLLDESIDLTHAWTQDIKEIRLLQQSNRDQVHFLGFVSDEDLVALYNVASVFLMPSLYEGFGLPVLEAMSCGCPVITSSKGSLREVAGDAAYNVDPSDISGIAEGLQKIIEDKQFAKRLSEKGLKQARKFSWKKTADETVSVYEKIFT